MSENRARWLERIDYNRGVQHRTKLPIAGMAFFMLVLLAGAALHLKISSRQIEEQKKLPRWTRDPVPVHPKDPTITPDSPEYLEGMSAVESIRVFFAGGGHPSGLGPGAAQYRAALDRLRRVALRLLFELEEIVLDENEHEHVRGAVLDVLAPYKEQAMWQLLAGMFVEPYEHEYIRSKCLDYLSAYETEENFEILKQVYDFEPEYPDRFRLILAIGRTRCERAVPVLLAAAGDDQPYEKRCAAAQALGLHADRPEVRARLLAIAGGDHSAPVRQAAMQSLAAVPGGDVDAMYRTIADNPREPDGLRKTARVLLEKRRK